MKWQATVEAMSERSSFEMKHSSISMANRVWFVRVLMCLIPEVSEHENHYNHEPHASKSLHDLSFSVRECVKKQGRNVIGTP